MIRSKLRMKRDAHQSALAFRLNIRNCKKRRRAQLPIFIDAHAAGPLSENHAAIRGPDYRPDNLEVRNDSFNFETAHGLRRGFNFSSAATRRRMTTREDHRELCDKETTRRSHDNSSHWDPQTLIIRRSGVIRKRKIQ